MSEDDVRRLRKVSKKKWDAHDIMLKCFIELYRRGS